MFRAEIPDFFTLADFTGEMVGGDDETIENLEKTDTREVYFITSPKNGSDPAGNRLSVFMRVGNYVYWVEYSGTKVAYAQFKDTFTQSAARIIVKDTALGAPTTSTTGTGAATTTTTVVGF